MEIDRVMFAEVAEESYVDLRTDYSGRGMYGKDCPAVVGSVSQFALFILAIDEAIRIQHPHSEFSSDEAVFLADNVSTDSMGYSTVFYWPSLELTSYDDEEWDQED